MRKLADLATMANVPRGRPVTSKDQRKSLLTKAFKEGLRAKGFGHVTYRVTCVKEQKQTRPPYTHNAHTFTAHCLIYQPDACRAHGHYKSLGWWEINASEVGL